MRTGMWWITDTDKFRSHYPHWQQRYDLDSILREIYELNLDRWTSEAAA